MRIQMNTLLAGPNEVRPVGWIGDVPTAEAVELVGGHYAKIVDAKDQDALDKALAKKNAPEKK